MDKTTLTQTINDLTENDGSSFIIIGFNECEGPDPIKSHIHYEVKDPFMFMTHLVTTYQCADEQHKKSLRALFVQIGSILGTALNYIEKRN